MDPARRMGCAFLCYQGSEHRRPWPISIGKIHSDLGIARPTHGNLQSWADQGVLLLNAVLSVESGQAGSHQGKGWEIFTDAVVQALTDDREGLVFMLWGSYAQRKGAVIDRRKHLVLKAPHPSPLSAHRGFLGCKHFSLANDYLLQQQQLPIDWSVPEQAWIRLKAP